MTDEVAYAAAVAAAKALRLPGARIFFKNIDTGDWNEIAREERVARFARRFGMRSQRNDQLFQRRS